MREGGKRNVLKEKKRKKFSEQSKKELSKAENRSETSSHLQFAQNEHTGGGTVWTLKEK